MSIKFEHVVLASPEQMEFIIEGMRNPMNSWEKSDTCFSDESCVNCYDNQRNLCDKDSFFRKDEKLGSNDHSLMQRLSNAGTEHRKYMRMMPVYVRITAPLYWWKEFDTYSVGVAPNPTDIIMNSCSTMHKIAEKEFTVDDFSTEHLLGFDGPHNDEREVPYVSIDHDNISPLGLYRCGIIPMLNICRKAYLKTKSKTDWWQMIQLLPSTYNQTRNVMLNYEVLANIYRQRKNHKLDEWREFCKWIESLPYSELITGKYVHTKNDCVECIYYNQPYNQTSFSTEAPVCHICKVYDPKQDEDYFERDNGDLCSFEAGGKYGENS